LSDVSVGNEPEERTIELDRETLGQGVPRDTNDSSVHETDGTRKTEIYRNDYESALPDHYKLIRMIGRGGMSEVFLAADERLGRNVAIKFLNSEFRRDPDRMRRFNREARAASALNHPNILIIHDIGENEGVQYIVSEFVDGETLGSLIANGKLAINESVGIAMQVASALAASHHAGIVHRDIKPDNIMVRRDGSVKILDFGLAKDTGGSLFDPVSGEARTLEDAATSPGLILGTPQYMSPEQARGKPLDARTDVFSFGVILFEMVTGHAPFPGTNMVDVIAALISKEPLPLSDFLDDPPVMLERILHRSLEKDRTNRYSEMDEVLVDLRSLQAELSGSVVGDHSTMEDQPRTTRPITVRSFLGESRSNRNLALLAVIAIPIVGLLVWWFAFRTNLPVASPSAGAMRMVPITNWSSGTGELVSSASFSPDAKMIAFAATKTGATEVWVKPVTGGEPIQVTKSGFYNQYPVWSPNGQNLAFFSSRNGVNGIWQASFTGGEQVQIASGVSPIARPLFWSKEGKIYLQDGGELSSIDVKTGAGSKLTDFASKGIKPRTIELYTDENSIAYSVREDGVWKIYVSDIQGGQRQEIAASPEQIDDLVWDVNGKAVIYSSSSEGAYQVFRASIGESKPVQLSNGNLDFFVRDVSSDGSSILYSSVAETSDLWSVDISDGKQTPLANEVAAEYWPDIAADGKSIVYQSVSQADRPFRGTVNFKTIAGNEPALTLSTEGFAPAFSKDGQWVAYFRRSDPGISIWRVRASGGEALKLADGNVSAPSYFVTPYLKIGNSHLAWSADGASIAYAANTDGISDIWITAFDGTKNTKLTANKDASESYCCPVWSPDGRSIAFTSEFAQTSTPPKRFYRSWSIDPVTSEQHIVFESADPIRFIGFANDGAAAIILSRAKSKITGAVAESTQINVVSLKTGARSAGPVLQDVYFNNIYASPDGRMIAYVTRSDNITVLWTIPLNGGSPKQVAKETDPKILYSTLTWADDGRSIVFGKQTRTNMLSMLSN
jgi:serine/threonine protein kinase